MVTALERAEIHRRMDQFDVTDAKERDELNALAALLRGNASDDVSFAAGAINDQVSGGPSAAELRATLEHQQQERELRDQEIKRQAQQREAGIVFPRDRRAARHEASHAVSAIVLGLQLENVNGATCWARVAGDYRDAVFSLAGEASERIERADAIASPQDLAVATEAMGADTQPYHWREVRRRASALVSEWDLGIDAVARQLTLRGHLSGAAVWSILERCYRGERAYYGDVLHKFAAAYRSAA